MTTDLIFAAAERPALAAAVTLVALGSAALAWRTVRRSLRGRRPGDALTLAAAGIATCVAAQRMWRFFGDVLRFSGPLRVLLFAFIELAVLASAVRARATMREFGSAGVDGAAVWALTGLSAVLSAMDSRSVPEALFRAGRADGRRLAVGARLGRRAPPGRPVGDRLAAHPGAGPGPPRPGRTDRPHRR
jgi:hypothetical protein